VGGAIFFIYYKVWIISYISESYTPEQLNAFPEIDSAIQAAAAGNPQTGLGKNKNIDISPAQDKPGYITISGSNLGRKNLNATNYKNEINPSKTHSASFSRKLLGAWAPDTGEGSQDGMSPRRESRRAREK
jgi:hypothetical protein